jgi:hypothetical protein
MPTLAFLQDAVVIASSHSILPKIQTIDYFGDNFAVPALHYQLISKWAKRL